MKQKKIDLLDYLLALPFFSFSLYVLMLSSVFLRPIVHDKKQRSIDIDEK